jgi:hypothetical protein
MFFQSHEFRPIRFKHFIASEEHPIHVCHITDIPFG